MKKIMVAALLFLVFSLLGPATVLMSGRLDLDTHWRDAVSTSTRLAPDPRVHREAIVQVYAARAYSWRGAFGVHPWIAIKPAGATKFTVYEVSGWRVASGRNAIAASYRPPDGSWYGHAPELLFDLRGKDAAAAIPKILAAIKIYPYTGVYNVWPGPNSNTFVAHIARQVPELRLDLPATAVGKDYIPGGFVARTPSGTGWQVSLWGLAGVLAGTEEGLEVNLLAMTFGIDPADLAVKLPGWGRLSLKSTAEAKPGAKPPTPQSAN